ncbi:MAG: single-stranded DNA-binding protein [Gammaproteobacteria bacterium]
MSNRFSGDGNLGKDPELRFVPVKGEQRAVAEMRVYFDRQVQKDHGEYRDEGGFWLTVSLWDGRAEQAVKVLKKGARIRVEGVLRLETWEDNGQERSEMRLSANRIAIDPICIESLIYRNGAREG